MVDAFNIAMVSLFYQCNLKPILLSEGFDKYFSAIDKQSQKLTFQEFKKALTSPEYCGINYVRDQDIDSIIKFVNYKPETGTKTLVDDATEQKINPKDFIKLLSRKELS